MSNKTKDLISRAAWTFAQTFIVVWGGTNFALDKTAILAAAAAGLSAIKTFVKESL